MKKMNLLVMSLVSAAALSFTSCSSNDDLAGNAGQEKVDGFYMTLNVQTPKSDGTRTVVNTPTVDATAAESDITSGTIYLVDAAGKVVFKKEIAEKEWKEGKPTQGKDGSTKIKIEVDKVVADQTYRVYFLAGSNKPADDMNFAATNNNFFTATKSFASPFADDNNFAMFNQNDSQVDGNGYTVTFIKANNNEANPAKVTYKSADGNTTQKDAAIKVERVVARIDAPSSTSKISTADPDGASEALKVALKEAREKVASFELTNYAISNLANKSYVMQTWNSSALVIPSDKKGFSYIQPKSAFGGDYDYKNGGFTTTATKVNYVFENNSTENPTSMYFEYKVTLKDYSDADFKDDATNAGTFYRYNNVIYTSFTQIFKDYEDVANLFGEGMDAKKMKDELKSVINNETELAAFRQKYNIEVFKGGKTYYKQVIKDNHIAGIIQRNSIYRLTVNNIFNVGAQVPNGIPTENEYYYLNVTVTVNPWVLNTQDVNLQ